MSLSLVYSSENFGSSAKQKMTHLEAMQSLEDLVEKLLDNLNYDGPN